jgi:uncharacterized phage protein gp47/JayE
VSFIDRQYPDIVRDVLTNLTNGVSREAHRVDYDPAARPAVVPDITLGRRPVKRVSLVTGFIRANGDGPETLPYTFTLNDYELVSRANDDNLDTIRFLPFGQKPAPGSSVEVNYYPRGAEPAVVTDLNVGSVVRTLVEALGRELAVLYEQLNLAYDSGFLETATGVSLDRVVALLGQDYRRYRAGRPVGTVRFTRRAGMLGSITIPVATPVTDAEDKVRYETVEMHSMLPGETTAEVRVRGSSDKTPPVEAGVLTVVQRPVAGIDAVVNDRPTTRASQDETDEELRARARGALLACNKGTVDSIRFGLLQLEGVRDVKVEEMPNGVPGEVRLVVGLKNPPAAGASPPRSVVDRIADRIEELRPAGIRVERSPDGLPFQMAASVSLQIRVELVLAGSHRAPSEIENIHARARETIIEAVGKTGVGQKVRLRPLASAVLADERVVDASIALGEKGRPLPPPGQDFEPPAGVIVSPPERDDVVFGPDAFDQQPPAAGVAVTVEVRASVAAAPAAGVAADAVRAQLTERLEAFFANLTAGAQVTADALLTALRDDTKYAVDPLRLQVTLTTPEQFVQVAQGGPSYTVGDNQTFAVVSVEVAP